VELAKASLLIRVKTGDSFAVPVAASVAIGRLGCFSAGCCYGTETSLPWGVNFGDGLRRHPTQLYESAFHLTAAFVLAWLQRKGLLKGQLIKLYIIAYLLYRFATEFIRPEPALWLGLSGYQWACLALLPVFSLLWLQDERQLRAAARAGIAARAEGATQSDQA
jgi:phosphatidylglycerol:prolipoprotein diacylglycerol transferase